MMKPVFPAVLAAAAVLALGGLASCDQSPIFYNISNEPEPTDPLIKGTPAQPVVLGDRLYTASLNSPALWVYGVAPGESRGAWSRSPNPPGGAIEGLAALEAEEGSAGGALYALTFSSANPESAALKRLPAGGAAWETVDKGDASGYPRLQTVHAAGGVVFVGAQKNDVTTAARDDFAIFYVDEEAMCLRLLEEKTGLLQGAVWDEAGGFYYLGTYGGGVWQAPRDLLPAAQITGDLYITGLRMVGSSVTAAGRDGSVYALLPEASEFTDLGDTGYTLTGGMEVWRDGDGEAALLLLGILGSDSSLTHGYRELTLVDGELPSSISISVPGANSVSSVDNQAKYEGGLGTHPVLSLLQVPPEVEPPVNGTRVLFAGTPHNGLWSYRDRNGTFEWNAED